MTSPSLFELHQLGQHEEVLKLARTIDIPADKDPRSALIVAASLFHLERYSDSLKMLSALEPLIQTDDSYLNLLSLCLWRLGELDRSEQVFQFALQQHNDHLAISRNYVNFLIGRQKYELARQVLEQVIQAHPHDPELQTLQMRYKQLQSTLASPPDRNSKNLPSPQAKESKVIADSRADANTPAVSSTAQKPLSLHPEKERPDPVPLTEPVRLPATAATHDAGMRGGETLPVRPASPPTTIDPLLLAFSQEEVDFDKDNRRRLRDARQQDSHGTSPLLDGSKASIERIPTLPEPPLQEAGEELLAVIRAALAENQHACALTVADYLRRLDPSRHTELYRLCSEAYAGLSNYPTSELCLQTLEVLGKLNDYDRLNLAGMALRRHDLMLADHYLAQIENPELHRDILLEHQEKLKLRKSDQPPSLIFTVKGLKAVRLKSGHGRPSASPSVPPETSNDGKKSPAVAPSKEKPPANQVPPDPSLISQHPNPKRGTRSRKPSQAKTVKRSPTLNPPGKTQSIHSEPGKTPKQD